MLVGVVSILATSGLVADEFDKKTNITVNETILIPGRTLPPGKYVMKLMNSSSNRNIVQIFNENQNKLEATILAINNYRLQPTDKTVLRYWETPSGTPPALRAWFFPGDNYGQEFAYPKDTAMRIAKENNNAKVPYYEGQPTPSNVASLELHDVDTTSARQDTNTAAAQTAPANDSTLLAQNNTPEPSQQSTTSTSTTTSTAATPDTLPRTASPIPLIALAGGLMLLFAVGLRLARMA